MNYLSVENLSKSYGIRTLFKGLSFGINQGEKVAFVARNGAGKSSLMRILAGSDTSDEGSVVFRKGIKIGFLEQEPVFSAELTVEDVIFSGDSPELQAIARYERAAHNPDYSYDFQAAFDLMDSLGAWDYELGIQNILSELKLDKLNITCGNMSGGQTRRLALARVLIDNPDFLILDEPTNHLDLEMVEWLESYLSKERITLFMVTHDRYFLDRVCTDILELDDSSLWRYKGNYSYFLEKRAERYATLSSETSKAQNIMRTELEWIRRQPKARGTKSKARVDSFEDLQRRASQRIDDRSMTLEISMERLGNKIVELHHVSKSWDDLKVMEDFSYTFRRGERVGIVGRNGTGKSSFVRMITGDTTPDKGKVIIGDTIVFGHYSQQGIEINPGEKVIEVIKKFGDFIPLSKGRRLSAEQLLERFMFSRSAQWDFVEKLSGGERRRLYLCTVLIQNPNFLILDEPTNDLDILTLNVLEEFLNEYPGVLMVVSHDRYFMDKIVDHVFVFQGEGRVKDFPGTYSEYRVWNAEIEKSISTTIDKPKSDKPKSNTSSKLSYKETREFESLETDIKSLEIEKTEIESIFSSQDVLLPEKIIELSQRMGEIATELEDKTERWLELSMKMEE